ncbi:Multidrug effflux MFS transporter [Candidatus Bealeia paramacronuclearis]|uniref:Bcr/CflA family efflux transporter n=1 Tax=Candidatus Bealeia paramacronuclearis TaxID=1921001 RepID=A0ABZ2C369_9PROT|nr:Multidrug effflux MFS transporter [Candidatus Bealeia paramacronuclearis]
MSRPGQFWISAILILAIVVVEVATDIYIPTLSYLTQFFKTTEEAVNYSLSACLLGFSVAGPIFGPLSDSFGRKKLIILGLILFTLASFGCSSSQSIEGLIAWRFLQGMGTAGPAVLGWAILKDLYEGREAAHAMTTVGMAMTLSPAIAPLLGGYIAINFDWTWIFVIVGSVGAISAVSSFVALPETLHHDDRLKFSIKGLFATYSEILKTPGYILPNLIDALTYGCLWSYLSATTFFFVNRLGFTMIEYAYFDAVLLIFYVIGSLYTRRLLKTTPIENALKKGIMLCILGSFALLFVSIFFSENAFIITAAMTVHSFGMALVFPNAATLALEATPDNLGSGSAMLSTLQCLTGGIMIIIGGYLYMTNIIWVSVMIVIASLLAYWFFQKLHLSKKLA